MNKGPEKNEVFGDYAAFLNALLPKAQGFLFHDRHACLFWHDNAPDTSQLNDVYHDTLNRTITLGELPQDQGRVHLRDCTAYLVRLVSDQGRTLGVLTALVDKDMGGMPWKFCSDLLQPAMRSLQRELSLRMHLLDVNQKLSQQGGEYDFLRQLGNMSREHNSCTEALRGTLELCSEQLLLDGAVFLAPDRNLRIAVGPGPVDFTEAELIFESMQDLAAENPDNVAEALASRPPPDARDRSRAWPIIEDGKRLAGILILSRPVNVEKLNDHANSLAGFVVSTIEYVLERGFDSLTGLINWPGFESSLEAASLDTDAQYTLFYMDIDQLEVINDNYGRESGNEVLRHFAGILRSVLGEHVVTRVTSDSFAALLKNCPTEQAEELANSLCEQIRSLDYMGGPDAFKPSVSIGIAPLIPNQDSCRSVLVPAQVACQAAKDHGRGRIEVYQSADTSIIRRMDEINIVGSIKTAIEAGRLTLFAQPIVKLDNPDTVNYYELLVRLLDSNGEPVEPAEFLTAAERYQLMQEIDRWVVTKAIETLAAQGNTVNNKALRFAVNLSGQSLGNDQFLDFVRSELARTGISPDRLCFEITETVAVSNLQKAQLFMSELKKMGCRFSLDDFGTGLSSFAYLKLFAVDKLKIDGSFVHDICDNEVSYSMVTAITEIARVMKLETVAEYVQDQATMDTLAQIGVDWAQGFHVGEPARLSEIFEEAGIADSARIADVDTALLTTLPEEFSAAG